MANRENPNVEDVKVEDAQSEEEQVVSKVQFDALLKQAQDAIAEANRRIVALEADKRVLQDALATQKRLVDKILGEK